MSKPETPIHYIENLGTDFEVLPGQTHVYEIELAAGAFVHATAQEEGVDIELRLRPSGKKKAVAAADTPTSGHGLEELVFITRQRGVYYVEVAAFDKPEETGGQVRLEISHWEAARPEHRIWIEAVQTQVEAKDAFTAGDQDRAVALARSLLKTWDQLGLPRQEVETLHWLGQVYLYREEFELAEACFVRAVALASANESKYWVASSLGFLGDANINLAEFAKGAEHSYQAAKGFETLQLPREQAQALIQQGSAEHRLGELGSAFKSFESSLKIMQTHPVRDLDLASAHESYGGVLLDVQRLWDARYQFNKALTIYRRLGDHRKQADSLKRLAHLAYRLGEFSEAEELLGEATEHLESMDLRGKTRDQLEYSFLLLRGRLSMAQGDNEASEEDFWRALNLAQLADDQQAIATCHLELGRVLNRQGNSTAGLEQLDLAVKMFTKLDSFAGQAIAGIRSAEALKNLGRPREALQRARPALEMAERQRSLSNRLDLRTDYFAFRQDFFDESIEILLLLHELEPEAGHQVSALALHEQRRARALLDVLALPAIERESEELDPHLLKREQALQSRLGQALRSLEADQVADILNQLHEVRGELRQSRSESPPDPDSKLPDLNSVAAALRGDDSLVLVYAPMEQKTQLWVLQKDQIERFELSTPRRDLEIHARRFVTSLSRLSRDRKEARRASGRFLSDALLLPIAHLLEGQRLVIAAAGDLQTIPFSALPLPGRSDEEYLILDHEVVMLPSLSTWERLQALEASRTLPSRGIVAFGDPVFESDDSRITQEPGHSSSSRSPDGEEVSEQERTLRYLNFRSGLGTLSRLAGSGIEVEAIRSMLGDDEVETYLGLEARRDHFLRPELSEFRVIHLATHAFQHPESPELSGFVLSLLDSEGASILGLVRDFEISPLKLRAELAVLSACETGRGKQVPGEGILGLARAFFNAGVPRVVSSLWKVEDQATATLMTNFYRLGDEEGMTAAMALRRAQLELLQEPTTKDPYYWAGFVFQGDWRSPERLHRVR